MKRFPRLALLIATGQLVSIPLVLARPPAAGPPDNPRLACHADLSKAFNATPHGKPMQFQNPIFVGDCQVCHGDGAAHIESADPAQISNPAKLSPVEASESCLKCHETQKHQMFWRGSPHDLAGNSCLSCIRCNTPGATSHY